jgi:hypothetical protein
VPFLFDAVSYVVSVFTLLLIRTPFQKPAGDGPQAADLFSDVREGLV